jgi:hypothetical protein
MMILKGQAVIAVCLIFIALVDKVFSEIIGFTAASIIITILIFLHLLSINLTLGPCCIIYCTEIVADITWIIITIKGLTLLIAFTSEYMIEYLGLGYMFLIFFGFTFLAHLFLRKTMKETKDKSPLEIYSSFGAYENI